MSRWLDPQDLPGRHLARAVPRLSATVNTEAAEAQVSRSDLAERQVDREARPPLMLISLAFVAAVVGFALQIGQTDLLIEEIAIAVPISF